MGEGLQTTPGFFFGIAEQIHSNFRWSLLEGLAAVSRVGDRVATRSDDRRGSK